MILPDYSFTTVSTDGPLTAPRWVHWLVKAFTGLALAWPFLHFLHWGILPAFLPGLLLVTLLHLVDLRWWYIIPVGASIRSWRFRDLMTADVRTDTVLHIAFMELLYVADFVRYHIVSALPTTAWHLVLHLAVVMVAVSACALIFRRDYPWATP